MDNSGMRFFHRNTKSKAYCSVYGCNSKACRDQEVRFHKFPGYKQNYINIKNSFGIEEKVDRRVEWEKVLRTGKKITSNMRVCSLHFSETDYFAPGQVGGRRYLKCTAVPSCNLPNSSVNSAKNNAEKIIKNKVREERLVNRDKLKNDAAIKLRGDNDQLCNSENVEKNVDELNDLSISLDQVSLADVSQKNEDTEPTEILKVDVGILVKSGDLIEHNFSNFIKTDKELSTATGIPSFKILYLLCKIVEKVAPILRSYTGKLTIQDRVILTFIKLKQNVSYAFLALLFQFCSERHIPNVVCNILDILGNALKDAIIFPSKQEILKNIPSCFREYANVCLILDCTEIEIQRPQNLCDQLLTYSFYKGRHTVKFLTGCSPGVLLTYVSPAYGGRASDKAIFEQSNIIKTIGTGSSIMVDKGFNIDDICFENGIRIIRPPFLRNKAQFSETEALDTRGIASARVHVERLNQRMKVFQILGSKMPSCLVKKSEHIMTIIAAVVNLSAPILKDDKFQK